MVNFKIPVLDKILAGIPDNSRLRIEISDLHAKLVQATERIKELEAQVGQLAVQDDILEEEIEILKAIYFDRTDGRTIDLSISTKIEIGKVEYHVDSLIERKFLDHFSSISGYRIPTLTKPGRAYLIERGLV